MKKRLATACLFVVTTVAIVSSPGFSGTVNIISPVWVPPLTVDKLFEKMDRTVSPGCAVAAMKDGKILYQRGYGMADLDHNIPITPGTVFEVLSMSKQFTAAAIVMLAQEGKLSLDDRVASPSELPDFGVPITIRELVSHTSGLRDQLDLLELAGWRYSLDLTTDDVSLPSFPARKS